MTEDPTPPFTVLAQAAIQMHEMFRAYIDAGFTPEQAMQLLVAIVTAHAKGGSS